MQVRPMATGSVRTSTWSQLQSLASQLRVFHGYRTLWLDEERQQVVHSEPDEMLEDEGLRYIDTVMQPDAEALAVVLGVVPACEVEPRIAPPVMPPLGVFSGAPA